MDAVNFFHDDFRVNHANKRKYDTKHKITRNDCHLPENNNENNQITFIRYQQIIHWHNRRSNSSQNGYIHPGSHVANKRERCAAKNYIKWNALDLESITYIPQCANAKRNWSDCGIYHPKAHF